MGVPQPKPLHGFLPNFQGMLTRKGLGFGGYPVITVAMATFLTFSGLKDCGCSTD